MQVGHQCPSHFLGQRQPNLAMSFSRYVDHGIFPIDIAQPQLDDIARTKSQTCQEKQNRTISPANRRIGITRRDDNSTSSGCRYRGSEERRQCASTGMAASGPTSTCLQRLESEETCEAPSCTFLPVPSRCRHVSKHELPETPCIEPPRIVSKARE